MMFVSKGTLERRCVLRRGKLHLQSYYNWTVFSVRYDLSQLTLYDSTQHNQLVAPR